MSSTSDSYWTGDRICLLICAVVSMGIPFAMLFLGAYWFDECSDYNKIGIYMVVQGLAGMMVPFLVIMAMCCHTDDDANVVVCSCLTTVDILFIIVWSIVGCVWAYNAPSDCKETDLFKATLGFSIPLWIVIGIYLVCYCCCRNKE